MATSQFGRWLLAKRYGDADSALDVSGFSPRAPTYDGSAQAESRRRARVVLLALPALVVAIGTLIVFSRRPDAFIHPQFWAEDGTYWYATAYNLGGLSQLFQPHTGYLQLVSRLTAAISMPLPVSWGPAVFVALAVAIQVAPAGFLVSERSSSLIASRVLRLLLAFLYLAIPNSFEVDANLTNAQWHLALLALLVLVARPPRGISGRAADVGVVALSGLSGPFALLLFPVGCIFLFVRRRLWTAVLLGVVGATTVAQLSMLFTSSRGGPGALGASVSGFFTIVGRQVFLGAIVGQWGLLRLSHWGGWGALSLAVGAAGVVAVLVSALHARAELRIVGLFGAVVLVASLASPVSSATMKDWAALSLPGDGLRYWLIPMFAFLTLMVGAMDQRGTPAPASKGSWGELRARLHVCAGEARSARMLAFATTFGPAIVVLVALAVGIPHDWRYPPFANFHFAHYAAELAHSKPGHSLTIPINPPGWVMTLVKRA